MKKHYKLAVNTILFLFMVSTQFYLNAQVSYDWAKQLSGDADKRAFDVVADNEGNSYTVGYFRGTVDFDPSASTFNLNSNGLSDIFICKLNATGNFVWAKAIGGPRNDVAYSIAINNNSELYVTGYFSDSADFNPTNNNKLYSSGGLDIFLAKYDLNGNYQWARKAGGNGVDIGWDVSTLNNKVYITGYFQNTVDFNPSDEMITPITSLGGTDAFVAKYNISGGIEWVSQFGGTGNNSGYSVAVDNNNNVYTTGYFENTVDFNPDINAVSNITSNGGQDIFITKLNENGQFLWAQGLGANANDIGRAIEVDSDNNAYITGYYENTVDFNAGAAVNNLTSAGNRDIYLLKINSNGDYLWANSFGSTEMDFPHDLTVDPSGYPLITGYFRGNVDFDPGIGSSVLNSQGAEDVFISKYNKSGGLVWARRMGGAGTDIGRGIFVNTTGFVYTAGFFSGTVDFDHSDNTQNLTSIGGFDNFITRSFNVLSTSIRNADCGLQTNALSDIFQVNSVNGATNYEYEFTNTTTSAVTFYIRGSNNVGASLQLAGLFDVGVSYNVRTRALVNGVWGQFAEICQIHAPAKPASTKLVTNNCGITLSGFFTRFFADPVSGAINYRFELTNTSTSAVTVYSTNSSARSMRLSDASLFEYGVIYNVRVQALVNGIWSDYNVVCTLNAPIAPPVPTITLSDTDCGITLDALSQLFYAQTVSNATDYEFEFTNTITEVVTNFTTGSSIRYTSLQTVGLLNLGASYSVRVRAKIATWGEFGNACLIHAPSNVTNTKLRVADCGFQLPGFFRRFFADAVLNASNYRFEFTNTTTFVVTEYETGSSNNSARLIDVGLLSNNVTYNVRVKALVHGIWGNYATVCQLHAPVSARLSYEFEEEDYLDNNAISLENHIYPNPSNGIQTTIVYHSSYEGVIIIELYELITNRLILSKEVNLTSGTNYIPLSFENRLSSGVHLFRIENNYIKFIVE